MSSPDGEDQLRDEVVEGLRSARSQARDAARERPSLDAREPGIAPSNPLPSIARESSRPDPVSPDREELNSVWRLSSTLEPQATRRLDPLLGPLRRLLRIALGPLVEQQERFNSAQVRFDNELVRYVDERIDRLSAHHDRVLGLHGKRMEEIDERHRILQEEVVRHVHDLVQRIEFVFESGEQNHLYLEGMLRETKEELSALLSRWESAVPGPRSTDGPP